MAFESFIIVIYISHYILYTHVYNIHNIIRNGKNCRYCIVAVQWFSKGPNRHEGSMPRREDGERIITYMYPSMYANDYIIRVRCTVNSLIPTDPVAYFEKPFL